MMQKAKNENFSEAFFQDLQRHTLNQSQISQSKAKKKTEKSFVICFWRCPTKRITDGDKKKRVNKRRKNDKAMKFINYVSCC